MNFLESVKKATSSVLTKTSENELKTITLTILREKVAKVMKIENDEFLGKDIKICIMETFQEFLLKDIENIEADTKKINSEAEEGPTKKKSKSEKPKEPQIVKSTPVKQQSEKPQSMEQLLNLMSTEPRTVKPKKSQPEKTKPKSTTSNKTVSIIKSAQIEKLKSYVFKCGVRKVWKREFEGLNEKQCISKLKEILKELGIDGKPTLEQCNVIRARRELEAELREIDTSNIIEGKRRRDTSNKKLVISESEESEFNDSSDGDENDSITNESDSSDSDEVTIDLNALGDSESDSD